MFYAIHWPQSIGILSPFSMSPVKLHLLPISGLIQHWKRNAKLVGFFMVCFSDETIQRKQLLTSHIFPHSDLLLETCETAIISFPVLSMNSMHVKEKMDSGARVPALPHCAGTQSRMETYPGIPYIALLLYISFNLPLSKIQAFGIKIMRASPLEALWYGSDLPFGILMQNTEIRGVTPM